MTRLWPLGSGNGCCLPHCTIFQIPKWPTKPRPGGLPVSTVLRWPLSLIFTFCPTDRLDQSTCVPQKSCSEAPPLSLWGEPCLAFLPWPRPRRSYLGEHKFGGQAPEVILHSFEGCSQTACVNFHGLCSVSHRGSWPSRVDIGEIMLACPHHGLASAQVPNLELLEGRPFASVFEMIRQVSRLIHGYHLVATISGSPSAPHENPFRWQPPFFLTRTTLRSESQEWEGKSDGWVCSSCYIHVSGQDSKKYSNSKSEPGFQVYWKV